MLLIGCKSDRHPEHSASREKTTAASNIHVQLAIIIQSPHCFWCWAAIYKSLAALFFYSLRAAVADGMTGWLCDLLRLPSSCANLLKVHRRPFFL